MHRVTAWPLVLVAACGAPSSNTPPSNTPSSARGHAEIVRHTELIKRLTAQGFTMRPVGDEILACGKEPSTCVCLAELTCNGPCMSLARNLDIFKRALAGENDGRTVDCELADTGKLCDTSYFRFEGDIYRWEDRYFDASGTLVGMKNATDYDEYCGGRAHAQFTGAVPDCREPARDVTVICSDHKHDAPPLGNPMANLRGFLGDGLNSGKAPPAIPGA